MNQRLSHGILQDVAASRHHELRTASVGAVSVGAFALGAVAMGAIAMGAVAIGRLVVGRARIRRLEIDELVGGRLRVLEELQTPADRDAEA